MEVMNMGTALPFTPFRNLIQVAYVTNDFGRALTEFGARYAVPKFMELRDLPVETNPGEKAQLHIALAWAGDVQIEIIEPRGGADRIYRDALPQDGSYALRFHHIAQLLDTEAELDALEAQMKKQGVRIAVRGSAPGSAVYFYSDHRDALGHYIEHIYYTPAGRGLFDMIPKA
jgi:Glyoxalase/Bleomycin resistance protein/Dioxygenase superfamily